MRFLRCLGILALAVLLNGTFAQAHHSFAAEYDSATVLTLTGTISKIDWTNPHIYIHLDVKGADGKVTTWSLEGYPLNTLKRTGFTRNLVKEGTTVTVTAYKAKDGSNTGAGREMTFPDNSKKFMGPEGR
ncbi:MAG: DUF6152 family protein [Acidobacteriota bacterium]